MKPLDVYRLFGQPGRVVYVLGPKDRILAARLIVGLMVGWIALVVATLWVGANWLPILLAFWGVATLGAVLFSRIRGRRYVISVGFRSNGQAFKWRQLIPLFAIWIVGIALLAAIAVWLP